ncbi:aminotransferase class III-fold pyridoxal phosphate-dependent enzyme [Paracoccaceae bacterium]|nr:aminotransferase class III-fold pyridoxal phosphate-dependent enzyme [Paracoccaceae bacterium]
MKIVAIVQARMSSTRLPGKVLKKLVGIPTIELLLTRLNRSKLINEICVATSQNLENDILCNLIEKLGYRVIRGSEENVLERFWIATDTTSADVIVRITGDCPIIDPHLVDKMIEFFLKSNVDYVSNDDPPTFPDGLDIEILTKSALAKAHFEAVSSFDREHVTPYIRHGTFTKLNFRNSRDTSDLRLTLDEPEDLDLLQRVFENFQPNIHFCFEKIENLLLKQSNLIEINNNLKRNEGGEMNYGQKLWKRAKNAIPGGNMLLSKRTEMHLPGGWPSYFSKTKGCMVWDLDGRPFIDTYLMGVGTNVLGYSHPEVDEAVIEVVKSGNMSTLNAPEEVYLAEKLIELHPWAGGVRFARSGGEANAIAIRIARAFSERDCVAVCGYHGWHDWYLSANLEQSNNLDQHLLPGLSTNGVPKSLRNIVHTFQYNDYEALKQLINKHPIGVIKMEVMRSIPPKDLFLNKVRKLCDEKGILLVFDECTSGFRETFGGLHKKFQVEPDLVVLGKTLGNGYAVSAVLGRSEIMDIAQNTFISSTFWTERIGSAAGLRTLGVMEDLQPWDYLTDIGFKVRKIWSKLAEENGVKIRLGGLPSLSTFSFDTPKPLECKTFLTQEMLKSGFLAGTAFYACICHDNGVLERYEESLYPIFRRLGQICKEDEYGDLLDSEVCHDGFKRLN